MSQDCRDFDFKNCTLAGGLVDVARRCYLKSEVNETFWNDLQTSNHSSRMPADEYFQ